jgi:aryl-alcohol dehydrogenase-like predicted oxidoreductase
MDQESARSTFYKRVEKAFRYLEQEVARGRIQAYGVSANTFVAGADETEFVSLERIWKIACRISSDHHFRVIQFPMNLLESGAVLEQNQSDKHSVLSLARKHRMGVLVNRPLNAFDGRGLVRLAEPETIGDHSDDDVIRAIRTLNKSETKLWKKLLPDLSLPVPLYRRIREQAAVADQLKHYWRNFGTYARWCQVRDGFLSPRIQGVLDYCERLEEAPEAIRQWQNEHQQHLKAAFRAVGSIYVADAEKKAMHIKRNVARAESSWARAETLSQQALRALRSTSGISSVLVGMRRVDYVEDVLQELKRPAEVKDRTDAWRRLRDAL